MTWKWRNRKKTELENSQVSQNLVENTDLDTIPDNIEGVQGFFGKLKQKTQRDTNSRKKNLFKKKK